MADPYYHDARLVLVVVLPPVLVSVTIALVVPVAVAPALVVPTVLIPIVAIEVVIAVEPPVILIHSDRTNYLGIGPARAAVDPIVRAIAEPDRGADRTGADMDVSGNPLGGTGLIGAEADQSNHQGNATSEPGVLRLKRLWAPVIARLVPST